MHLSLKGSLDRQPLTDRLGDRLLAEYGGAAAAYSLRALNGNGDNVVRVRRASDNDEKDFTAEQIELGEMVNWVNSQIVPPLDIGVETSEGRIPVPEGGTSIGTPAAAYSLRNLSTTYTGNVVDVRRSVGGTESFTAAEVADGTLTNWVNTDYVKYSSDFTSNDNGWGSFDDVTETGAVDGIGGLDGNLRLAIGSATSQHRAYKTNILPENQKSNFSARVFIPSTNSVVDGLQVLDAVGNTIINATSLTQDQWVTVTANDVTTTNSQLRVNLLDGSSTSFTGNSSDVVYLREITVTQVTSDGLVSKWYDQSGNDNHATQGTDASQPKIVDGGSLVSGGLDFDGVNDFLDTGYSSGNASSQSLFTLFKADLVDSNFRTHLDGRDANDDGIGFGINSDFGFRFHVDTADTVTTANTAEELLTGIYGSSSSSIYQKGTLAASGSAPSSISGTSVNYFIGKSPAGGFPFNGTIEEIIIYPTDQSANRTAIEANIGETYGITGIPAYDNTVDGFVETWYDQSGNGNDATQSVAASQPKIVDAGTLVTTNGNPTVDFYDSCFLNTDAFLDGSAHSSFAAINNQGATSTRKLFYTKAEFPNKGFTWNYRGDQSVGQYDLVSYNGIVNSLTFSNSTSPLHYVSSLLINSTKEVFINGNSVATSSDSFVADDETLGIGSLNFGTGFDIQELIIYPSDQTANRPAIEANINNHYSIYA